MLKVALLTLLMVVALAGCAEQGDRASSDEFPGDPSTGWAPEAVGNTTGGSDEGMRPEAGPGAMSEPTRQRPGVVVADVSFGVNPYHANFQRPGWTHHPSERVPGIPVDLPALDLTYTGSVSGDFAADAAVWASYEPGQVYWIPETNLLVLTLESYASGHNGYTLDGHHGIATADAINQACPDCYILVIQDWNNIDGGAMQYIADQLPWVDFAVSTSYGFNDIEYVDAALAEGYAAGTRAIWDRGGLAFGPTGNGILTPNGQTVPPTFLLHFVSLPPWVVMVGGSEPDCEGLAATASKPAEFVSDYRQYLAIGGSNESATSNAGTSFSTPKVAGLFAQTLLNVREELGGHAGDGALWNGQPRPGHWLQDGRLTNEELRAAMAQAAIHFQASEFQADLVCIADQQAVPASPTPWFEMGWGHLDDEQALIAATLILEGDEITRDAETETWMGHLEGVRSTFYPW